MSDYSAQVNAVAEAIADFVSPGEDAFNRSFDYFCKLSHEAAADFPEELGIDEENLPFIYKDAVHLVDVQPATTRKFTGTAPVED